MSSPCHCVYCVPNNELPLVRFGIERGPTGFIVSSELRQTRSGMATEKSLSVQRFSKVHTHYIRNCWGSE